jgi:hypothetical protein
VRDDNVPRLNGTRCDLRKEGLVGHVWKWVNQGDLCLARFEKLLQLPCGIKAGIAPTDNQYSLRLRGVNNLLEDCFRCL